MFFGRFSSFFSTSGKEYLLFPLIHNVGRKMINMYLEVICIQKKKRESKNLTNTYQKGWISEILEKKSI